uniref:Uncharacterized protein n=1 Tax=Cacopsylla melanoneura TaxID=428564 RepID=A0A8D9F456_9HEMI
MDFSFGRLKLLLLFWIVISSHPTFCQHYQLQPGHSNQIYQVLPTFRTPQGYHRGAVTILRPIPQTRDSRETRKDGDNTKQDGGDPVSMLQWMRQMIFKTKSMYTKHKLEFELSGCFMGFIRKIMSVIYNSLYSFNKKLMFAKKIKIEDIRGLGKTSNTVLNTTIGVGNDIKGNGTENSTSTKISETIDSKGDNLIVHQFNNVAGKDSQVENKTADTNDNKDKRHVREGMQDPTAPTNQPTNDLENVYEKLNNLKEHLERNLNQMNKLYENITLDIDRLKITIEDIREKDMGSNKLGSKNLSDIQERLETNQDQLETKVTTLNKFKNFQQSIRSLMKMQTNFTKGTRELEAQFPNNSNESDHMLNNNSIIHSQSIAQKDTFSKDELQKEYNLSKTTATTLINQNEVVHPDEENLENYKKLQNQNKHNFTTDQIKLLSKRVKRLLNSFSDNSSSNLEFSRRQFSQESILDSINSVILYFLGFVPEEDSIAYFMSMVGQETTDNLLRIGTGFNAMRQSQIVSCMSHYGSTKFWNWVDSCC